MRNMKSNPYNWIVISAILVILGFILSFLMVINVLEKSFFLSFLSYAISFAGLTLGLFAIHDIISTEKRKSEAER